MSFDRENVRKSVQPIAQQISKSSGRQGARYCRRGAGQRRRSISLAVRAVQSQHRQVGDPGNSADDQEGNVVPPRRSAVRLRIGEEPGHVAAEEIVSQVTGLGMLHGEVPRRADDCRQGQGECRPEIVDAAQAAGDDEVAAEGNAHHGHARQPLGQDRQPEDRHAGGGRPKRGKKGTVALGPPCRTRSTPIPRSK